MNNEVYIAVFTDHDGDLYMYILDKDSFERLEDSSEQPEKSTLGPRYQELYTSVLELINDLQKTGDRIVSEFNGYAY